MPASIVFKSNEKETFLKAMGKAKVDVDFHGRRLEIKDDAKYQAITAGIEKYKDNQGKVKIKKLEHLEHIYNCQTMLMKLNGLSNIFKSLEVVEDNSMDDLLEQLNNIDDVQPETETNNEDNLEDDNNVEE